MIGLGSDKKHNFDLNSKLRTHQQVCGLFLLEDNTSLVEMLVGMGKDKTATEEALAWLLLSSS